MTKAGSPTGNTAGWSIPSPMAPRWRVTVITESGMRKSCVTRPMWFQAVRSPSRARSPPLLDPSGRRCTSWPANLQGTILLGLRASRLKWKTNSWRGARRPAQSPGTVTDWSHTYQPKKRQPCCGIQVSQSSQ